MIRSCLLISLVNSAGYAMNEPKPIVPPLGGISGSTRVMRVTDPNAPLSEASSSVMTVTSASTSLSSSASSQMSISPPLTARDETSSLLSSMSISPPISARGSVTSSPSLSPATSFKRGKSSTIVCKDLDPKGLRKSGSSLTNSNELRASPQRLETPRDLKPSLWWESKEFEKIPLHQLLSKEINELFPGGALEPEPVRDGLLKLFPRNLLKESPTSVPAPSANSESISVASATGAQILPPIFQKVLGELKTLNVLECVTLMKNLKGMGDESEDLHKALAVFVDVRRDQASRNAPLLPLSDFNQIHSILLPQWEDAACLAEILKLPEHLTNHHLLALYRRLWVDLKSNNWGMSNSGSEASPLQMLSQGLIAFIKHVDGCFQDQKLKESFIIYGGEWLRAGYNLDQVKHMMNALSRFPLKSFENHESVSATLAATRLVFNQDASLQVYADVVEELAKYEGEDLVVRFSQLSDEVEKRLQKQMASKSDRKLRPARHDMGHRKKEK